MSKYIDYPNNLKVSEGFKTDLDAIAESVRRLLSTVPGDFIDRPDYGCYLKSYLYDQLSSATNIAIRLEIERSLNKWEPRVRLDNVDVTNDQTTYSITIVMTLFVPEFDTTITVTEEFNKL